MTAICQQSNSINFSSGRTGKKTRAKDTFKQAQQGPDGENGRDVDSESETHDKGTPYKHGVRQHLGGWEPTSKLVCLERQSGLTG